MAGLRRLWLNLHLWLGVGLFIPVLLLGLSGAVLTFQDEIEYVTNPARYAVSAGAPLQASALLSVAREAAGKDFRVTSLRYPRAGGEPLIAQAHTQSGPRQALRIWIDPATGRVLDRANPRGGVMGVLHQLHGSLMIADIGRKVVGWIGWGLFISSVTGLWLWWPRNGAFFKGLRWTRGSQFSLNLHHLLGFWICIPLALLAASGVYISFPQSARTFTQTVLMQPAPTERRGAQTGGGNGGQPRGGAAPLAQTHLSIDDAVAAALRAAPHTALSAVTLPTEPRADRAPSWRIDLRGADAKIQTLEVDDTGGEAARGQNDNGFATAVRRLHDGGDQSILWRLLIALAGLAPAILGTTGLFMWLKAKKPAAPDRS